MENVKDLFNFRPRLNLRSIKKEIWGWLFLGLGLYVLALQIDRSVFWFFQNYLHTPELDTTVIFLTERLLYVILVIFLVVTGWRVWKNPNHHSKLLPGAFAAGIVGIILKPFFDVPRPFFQLSTLDPLVWAKLASFPSNHTAVAFALLIPIYRVSKILGWLWGVFAILVGVARVYKNVHFPSDIAGGIFLGRVIGAIFSNPNTELLLKKWWENLEFRRQSFHFLAGFMCVFAHWVGVLRWRFILLLLVGGLVLSAISAKKVGEERQRCGDLEVDLIIGKNHKQAMLTINDRASGMLKMTKISSKKAKVVCHAIIDQLQPWKPFIKTITSDNENLNGLIRQYFPKKTDFNNLSNEQLKNIENKLNHRPRKRFNYQNPIFVMNQLLNKS